MTVVLALRCADGIVMASDSQITDGGRGLTYPAQKLHPLGKHAAWGGSGSRAAFLTRRTQGATNMNARSFIVIIPSPRAFPHGWPGKAVDV